MIAKMVLNYKRNYLLFILFIFYLIKNLVLLRKWVNSWKLTLIWIRVIVSKSGYVPKTRHELKCGNCFKIGICSKRVQESLKINSQNWFIVLGWHFFVQYIILVIFYNYMEQFCSTRNSFKDILKKITLQIWPISNTQC